jgi:hypothetical protein
LLDPPFLFAMSFIALFVFGIALSALLVDGLFTRDDAGGESPPASR